MCVRSSARVGAAAAVTERAGLERRRFFSPRRLGLRLQGPRMASGFGTRAPVGRCFPVYRVRLALAVARRHPPRQRRILPARRSLRSASRRRVGRLWRRRRRARSCVRTTSSACTIKRRRASPTSGPRGVGAAMLPARVPLSFPSVCRRSHGSMRCPTSGRARSRLASRCPAR